MNETYVELFEVTLDQLIKKYHIQNAKEYELLKNGKNYIDSAIEVTDENARVRIGSALIEYLLYKMNGGK